MKLVANGSAANDDDDDEAKDNGSSHGSTDNKVGLSVII
jgi:hypothetical protein